MALDYSQIQSGIEQQQAAGHANIMDALAAYNQAQQQAYFAQPAAPAAPVATPAYEAPQGFLNLTSPAPVTPVQTGISALPISGPAYDPTKIKDIESLYQYALGRPADVSGKQYYSGIEAGGITPEEYQRFIQIAQPELQVQKAYQDVLGRKFDIPGLEYYTPLVQSGAIKPQDLQSAIAYGSRSLTDKLAAQDFLDKEIFGKEADLRSQYQTGFGKVVEDVFGSPESIASLEKILSTPERPFGLSSLINPQVFEGKGSLEDIRKQFQESKINQAQEADRVARDSMYLYGTDVPTAQKLNKDLYEGKSTDPLAKEYYDALIKGQVTPELREKIITDAAKKAPNSQYFKDNPQDLLYAKPIGELKRGEETSGQYGFDPRTGFALISEKAANKALDEKGDVFLGGAQDLYDNTSLQYLGADPHSKYQGHLGRGTGALGVTASKDEITDFARIEKELNRLGGVQRQVDPDTGSAMDVVYVERKDPESDRTYRVPVTAEQFFRDQLAEKYPAISEEDPSSQARFTRNFDYTSAYDYYKQTKDALDKIATGVVYSDPSKVPQYGSIKEAYDDLNDKTKNLYLWRGRTNTLDPEAMKKLGIEDPTADDSHIEVYLEKKGDYLVPKVQKEMVDGKIVEKPMITPFSFSDPNTSSGFFGDLFNFAMELMNTPLGMALGAYLVTPPFPGGTAPLAGATSSLAAQLPSGLTSLVPGINSEMIARSLISSGISALPAAAGGDFDRFGRAFLTNLAGSGVQMGAGALGANPFVSKLLGAGATAGLSGRDVEDALTRVATSEGINALLNKIPTGDFDKKLMAAFAPSILSGKLTPSDLMRITQAVNPPTK